MAISDSLGEPRELEVPAGTIRYRERGSGPVLVFMHGAIVNGDIWRKVVPGLADSYRCITPDWPLGSHQVPMNPGADLTPPGVAQIVIDFLDALGEDDVTLVSNDTSTALAQLVLVRRPPRVTRAVLTHGDAFKHFFPPSFKFLTVMANIPGAFRVTGMLNRTTGQKRLGYIPVSKTLREPAIIDSYADPMRTHAEIRRDGVKFLGSVRSRYTQEAAPRLSEFEGDVLVVWGRSDRVFPLRIGERLAAAFPRAELVTIDDTRTFIPEDQPQALIEAMRAFLARTGGERAATASAEPAGSGG